MDAKDSRSETALWIFGYGSLIWNPEFDFVRRQLAVLPGYHRSFCMRSIHHRGSETEPGLVLALDPRPDSACWGVAFGVAEDRADTVLALLRERELISSAYLEQRLPVRLQDGPEVEAVVYVVDTAHVQYCGGLDLEEQARIIARAIGGRGPNREYLYNTAEHLRDLGLEDAELDWLVGRVRDLSQA
jgi:cation transport protein ChaC